ncbi:MAG: type II toxin-antitoxin system prevent-host-death family antitoxin [Boseongicola sp.]|nr:type II toxin-antitoxin system prevent-host-death family antitoxin [Boseongicola sp.]MDE0344381.1 type II toxin-antitoxin system prevent-host-death family antitoxin [Boseongicola sp.]
MQASVHEAKTNLSKLLERMNRGERVIITRHGIPAAELVPARATSVKLGSLKNAIAPPPDEFLEPLGEDELRAWEGR